jgi:hypothetical protein
MLLNLHRPLNLNSEILTLLSNVEPLCSIRIIVSATEKFPKHGIITEGFSRVSHKGRDGVGVSARFLDAFWLDMPTC